MALFDSLSEPRAIVVAEEAREIAARAMSPDQDDNVFVPYVGDRTLDVFSRARNPADPFELRDLFLGRVEHELGGASLRPELAQTWRRSRRRREVTADEVYHSRSAVRFVKELFNFYFRDDLYGALAGDHLLLSSGSVDEQEWGLPAALKDCLRFALDQDWYGYSDSRGRVPAREAIAAYENALMERNVYTEANVAITLGGTFTVSNIADYILTGRNRGAEPALCGIPNYPPLVEAVARRGATRMVPLASTAGKVSLRPLIDALRPDTPLVLLQTAINPTGAVVDEAELAQLVRAASPSTMILLDECHEWLGPERKRSALRAAPNVIRISSLSKNWSAPGLKTGWIMADQAFVADYYEHASTMFGGPQSFFYTAVEVLARMERWMVTGLTTPGPAELAEFEPSYGLTTDRLRRAYTGYVQERRSRHEALTVLRAATCAGFSEAGTVTAPAYSINAAVRFPDWDDSYLAFRSLLDRTGVSTYPAILNFCFDGGAVRLTTARPWADLREAGDRVRSALHPRQLQATSSRR
ncbi:pyridoxal phosphate-dependent aminotransferase [Lentzea sp.]|uniref:pyridoxal phosphate-dependent aminotransferase n=1 Tax=Lentzea sp. TaxID=56099 RepID=UPI002BD769DD|nr:pyridoxal phosphate-dependent aminotransferase [Lentzea sp.]HUQ54072.1 pyridoxal phosphate-dependent aminotransferase [Lentzea sp.]